jgi:hypothetical protein
MTRRTRDVPAASSRRRLLAVLAGAAAVALAVTVILVRPEAPGTGRAAAATAAETTPSPVVRSSAAPRPSAPRSPATTTVPAAPDPAHEAELREVAAGLPPVALGSPALWDQWLPEGKPYPGADLADDLSTCPVLSSRLEAVTGQEMSYWTGTLPGGPFGCTWVEIPLSGQDNDYDYVVGVGFLADGTTVEPFRQFREKPGPGTRPCPSADLPSVRAGSLLVRCTSAGSTVWTLAVPDTRLAGGLWVLTAQSKDSTPVRPAAILPVLVDGVIAAFG